MQQSNDLCTSGGTPGVQLPETPPHPALGNCGTSQFPAHLDRHNDGHGHLVQELHLWNPTGFLRCLAIATRRHNDGHGQLVQELQLRELHNFSDWTSVVISIILSRV